MDGPKNPMVICAVMITGRPLALSALRDIIATRLLPLPRFCHPLSRHPGGEQRAFDLNEHVHLGSLGPEASEAQLHARIGELLHQQLPADRPLWDVHLIDSYRGGSVLVWRFHHAVGDGTALLKVLLRTADGPPSDHGVAFPVHPPPRASDAPRALASLARVVFLPRDSRTPLKAPLSGMRHVAWSAQVPVAQVKAIGQRAGATVNDVLTCALAGALHRYLAAHSLAAPRQVRAIVPFDLRSGETGEALGNRFGLLFLPLAVGAVDAGMRLAAVRRQLQRLKRSPEAFVTFALLQLVGVVSPWLASEAIRFFAAKSSLVLTNVAGPKEPLSLAGAPITDVVFWVPQAQRIGLGLSIFSYAGHVRVGVNADTACVERPQELADAFIAELDALAEPERAARPVDERGS